MVYSGLEYYSEYFPPMIKYSWFNTTDTRSTPSNSDVLYSGCCLYSSLSTAQTPSTQSILALSTAHSSSTPSI